MRLAERFAALDLRMGRLKTGTPARLAGPSIDWASLEMQPGDDEPVPLAGLPVGWCVDLGDLAVLLDEAGDLLDLPGSLRDQDQDGLVVDDRAGVTLASASTHEADLRDGSSNKDSAAKVGTLRPWASICASWNGSGRTSAPAWTSAIRCSID